MKKKKGIFLVAAAIMSFSMLVGVSVSADGPKPKKVTRITSSDKTISVGEEFELKAKMSPVDADDDYLRWKIVGKKGIIKFDDDDRNDDEAEFVAVKEGTTKVRCEVAGKSKKYAKTFTVTVSKPSYKLTRAGRKTITVEVGDEEDLKVKISGGKLKDKYLKWTIENTKILKFEDGDRYGDEVEVKGRRIGTTKVTCKNLKNEKTVTFTVNVVRDDVDDDDYDDD